TPLLERMRLLEGEMSESGREALGMLSEWDLEENAESQGAPIYELMRRELTVSLRTTHCVSGGYDIALLAALQGADWIALSDSELSAAWRGAVDEALAKHKLRRNIVVTTPGFMAVPFIVRRSRVITTMPSRLARYFSEAFGLATSPVPIELPSFTISLLWHTSFDHDPGHLWLRQTVAGVAPDSSLAL
ncbi:MAG: hypothetical protein KAX78_02540, partial [Phycisphaerae bacterium]|nr:hypothetical protein [Phycisphaerae bacterium]